MKDPKIEAVVARLRKEFVELNNLLKARKECYGRIKLIQSELSEVGVGSSVAFTGEYNPLGHAATLSPVRAAVEY